MEKTFLFFDIECANMFDGVGKICSFGYVLTDEDFNIMDSDDVVMNPETEFDWYLFSPKNKCPLAYSKDYFRSKPNFEAYYKPIKNLLEFPGRKVIGFGSKDDVGFIVSACERYGLAGINFSSWDISTIISQKKQMHKSLVNWCEEYKIDVSGLTAHKSCDDAMMTMLVAKAFCQKQDISLEQLLDANKDIKLSVEKYLELRENRFHIEELSKKIAELFGKKSRAPLTKRLQGEYSFGFKIKTDIDLAFKLANLVYRHGGMLMKNLKKSGTVIMLDDCGSEIVENMKKRGLSVLTVQQFEELVRME